MGTAGKVVSLLSSGIDSPVATWMVDAVELRSSRFIFRDDP